MVFGVCVLAACAWGAFAGNEALKRLDLRELPTESATEERIQKMIWVAHDAAVLRARLRLSLMAGTVFGGIFIGVGIGAVFGRRDVALLSLYERVEALERQAASERLRDE